MPQTKLRIIEGLEDGRPLPYQFWPSRGEFRVVDSAIRRAAGFMRILPSDQMVPMPELFWHPSSLHGQAHVTRVTPDKRQFGRLAGTVDANTFVES